MDLQEGRAAAVPAGADGLPQANDEPLAGISARRLP